MIRPATLGFLVVAGVAGGLLFQVSDGARALQDELSSLKQKIAAATDDMHVLRAEWSYLNQPARLEELSRRYLGLAPLSGAQVVELEMLPMRQPPAAAPAFDSPPPAIVDAIDVAPPPENIQKKIQSHLLAIAIRPQPKPSAPARTVPQPTRRAADRSLDDVLADLLSPAPGNAR